MKRNQTAGALGALFAIGAGAACSDDGPATIEAPLTAVCVESDFVVQVDDWVCGAPRIVECNDHIATRADVDLIYVSVDVVLGDRTTCDEVSLVISHPGPFAVGETTVIVYERFPEQADLLVCESTIAIVDGTPPEVVVHDVELRPPNHKMHELVADDCLDVFDACDADVAMWFTGAASDEPADELGDGNFEPDIVDLGDGAVALRAERSGTGNGRVYTLDWRVEDVWGNWAEGNCRVAVPHDNGKPWVQDGEAYRVTLASP